MLTLYARRHEFSRNEKFGDMVDVYSKSSQGKPYLLATVHIDSFDGLPLIHPKLSRTNEEVELRILDEYEEKKP
jgi:hypothetical protein